MNSQSIALADPAFADAPAAAHHGSRRGIGRFLGHFGEMAAAMMIGMAVPGMPLRALQVAVLGPESAGVPELRALGMAASMTVAMVAWMRFRGHSWRASAEMAAAMMVPTVALLPLLWLDLVSGRTLVAVGHGVMLPAMLAAMLYRRREYGL